MTRNAKVISLRESARYQAVDERGVTHTVVERTTVGTCVTMGIRNQHMQMGMKTYYSSTSGDVLVLLADGTLEGHNGTPRLCFEVAISTPAVPIEQGSSNFKEGTR